MSMNGHKIVRTPALLHLAPSIYSHSTIITIAATAAMHANALGLCVCHHHPPPFFSRQYSEINVWRTREKIIKTI